MDEEGVVKFRALQVTNPPAISDPLFSDPLLLDELNGWRSVLQFFGLIGQDHSGVGYDNLSRRLSIHSKGSGLEFIITGSQTGHLQTLGIEDYVAVISCFPDRNLAYYSPLAGNNNCRQPSSESMTHYAVYAETDAEFVFHVHSREIWQARSKLSLPATPEIVKYGTPAMAEAMRRLLVTPGVSERRIMAMGGHPDGIIAWGRTAEETDRVIMENLAEAKKAATYESSGR